MTLLSTFPEGLGGSLGDSMGVNAPFYSTGNVWYVHASTGTDAAAPAGRNRAKPLATLAQAQTNAADGDTVVLLDGHTETLTAALDLTKVLTIVGEGESDGKPTVKYTNNSAAANLLTVSVGCDIRNVWFEENSQANSAYRLDIQGPARVVGCYFECGALDDAAAVRIGSDDVHLKNCTFVSTATLTSAQPHSAIEGEASDIGGLYVEGLTLDGGTVGFSNFWAMDLSEATIPADNPALIEGLTLLRGADVLLPATGHAKVVDVTATGGSVIDWNGTTGAGV